MSFGVSPYGDATFGDAGGGDPVVSLSAAIKWTKTPIPFTAPIFWTGATVFFVVPITWETTDLVQLAATASWTPTSVQLSVPVRWQFSELVSLAVTVRWDFSDPASWPFPSAAWKLTISIDGTDVSDRVVGQCTIDREEDSAALAEFSIRPNPGPLDPMTWLNKRVIIDAAEYVAGSLATSKRRYTGILSNAVYNPDTGEMLISATTDLQGTFENTDREQIDAIVGGHWSENVFDGGANGWDYMNDRLSTVPRSVWQDESMQLRIADWAAKETPDFTFVDSARFDGTLTIERATRRDVLNRVKISLDYRFVRKRERHVSFSTQPKGWTTEDMLRTQLLGIDMVEIAIDSSDWELIGDVRYVKPRSGVYWVFSENGGGLSPIVAIFHENLITGAYWTMAKRWVQTVTEKRTILVQAPDSIEYSGVLGVDESYGIEAESDTSDFESEPFSEPLADAVQDNLGDWVVDEVTDELTGRAAFEESYLAIVEAARVDLLRAHRQNTVSFEIPFHQAVSLEHTVKVQGDYLTAQGKVRRVVDQFDVSTGQAVTTLELALSRHGGSGIATDSPVATDEIESTVLAEPDRSIYLPWHIGGQSSAPVLTGDEIGFFTNRLFGGNGEWNPNIQFYDRRFTIETPEIESDSRDSIDAVAEQTLDVVIPQDLLEMSA